MNVAVFVGKPTLWYSNFEKRPRVPSWGIFEVQDSHDLLQVSHEINEHCPFVTGGYPLKWPLKQMAFSETNVFFSDVFSASG